MVSHSLKPYLLNRKIDIGAQHVIYMLLQDTCVGFLLGGVGEINKHRQPNFMVVDKSMYISCILMAFANSN